MTSSCSRIADPKGYPGFPEVGNFALPAKILKQGVTDMIRISDARMSGTAYGTVVLHTAPGGRCRRPAGAGRKRRHDRARRRRSAACSCTCPTTSSRGGARNGSRRAPHADRGWVKLYCDTVQQADKGVDLDFLVGGSGAAVGRESH